MVGYSSPNEKNMPKTKREGMPTRERIKRTAFSPSVIPPGFPWRRVRRMYHFFGGGLHVSPSPRQALARSGFEDRSGARFFEVTCPVSELVSVADDVCKAPRLRVVREVDSWGEPL